jgi:Family of unknown function (DUF5330)
LEKNAAGFQLTFQCLLLGFRLSGQAAMGLRGKLMRFLFRMMFWLGVVLILLPSGGTRTSSDALVSASDAMSAARATVDDASSFCDRQPEACVIGSQAAAAIGHRASVGAKMLYDYLNGHFGADNVGAGRSMAQSATHTPHDTLTQADLAPAWRGLRVRREVHLDHPQ